MLTIIGSTGQKPAGTPPLELVEIAILNIPAIIQYRRRSQELDYLISLIYWFKLDVHWQIHLSCHLTNDLTGTDIVGAITEVQQGESSHYLLYGTQNI